MDQRAKLIEELNFTFIVVTALPDLGSRHVRVLPAADQVRGSPSLHLAQEPLARRRTPLPLRRRGLQPLIQVTRQSLFLLLLSPHLSLNYLSLNICVFDVGVLSSRLAHWIVRDLVQEVVGWKLSRDSHFKTPLVVPESCLPLSVPTMPNSLRWNHHQRPFAGEMGHSVLHEAPSSSKESLKNK